MINFVYSYCFLVIGLLLKYGNGIDFKSLQLDDNLKILIFTIDNRDIDNDLSPTTSSHALATVLNYHYSAKNGYDFKHFIPTIDPKRVHAKFNVQLPLNSDPQDTRKTPFVFNVLHKHYRGITWSKLLVMWHICKELSAQYDFAMYVDSDLAVTAAKSNRTITDAIKSWKRDQMVTWGPNDLEKVAMIFFPNSPYGNWEPATGAVLFRPAISKQIIEEWWDFDSPDKNLEPYFEQHVLWTLFQYEPQTKYALNKTSTAMVSEHQFPVDMTIDDWCFHRGWLCHISSNFAKDRHRVFRRILHMEAAHPGATAGPKDSSLGGGDGAGVSHLYRTSRQAIAGNTVTLDMLDVAEKLAAESSLPPISTASGTSSAINENMVTSTVPGSHNDLQVASQPGYDPSVQSSSSSTSTSTSLSSPSTSTSTSLSSPSTSTSAATTSSESESYYYFSPPSSPVPRSSPSTSSSGGASPSSPEVAIPNGASTKSSSSLPFDAVIESQPRRSSRAGEINTIRSSGARSPTETLQFISLPISQSPNAFYAGNVTIAQQYAGIAGRTVEAQSQAQELLSQYWVDSIGIFLLGGLKGAKSLGIPPSEGQKIDYFSRAEASKLTWARYVRHLYYVTGTGPAEEQALSDASKCVNLTAALLPSGHFKDQQQLYDCRGVRVLHFPQCSNEAWGAKGPCCRCSHSMRFFLQLTWYRANGNATGGIHADTPASITQSKSSLRSSSSAAHQGRSDFTTTTTQYPPLDGRLLDWFVFADDDYFIRAHMLEALLRNPATPPSKPFSLYAVSSLGDLVPGFGMEMYNKACNVKCVHRMAWMSFGGFSIAALHSMEPAIRRHELTALCETWKLTHDVGLGVFTWLQSMPAIPIYDREMFQEQLPIVWHNPIRWNAEEAKYDLIMAGLWRHAVAAWEQETGEKLSDASFDLEILIAHEKYRGEYYWQHIPHYRITGYLNSKHHRRKSRLEEMKHLLTDDLPLPASNSGSSGEQLPGSESSPSSSASLPRVGLYAPSDCAEDSAYFQQWITGVGSEWATVASGAVVEGIDARAAEAKMCLAYGIAVGNGAIETATEDFSVYLNNKF